MARPEDMIALFTASVWGLLSIYPVGSMYVEPSIGDVMLSDRDVHTGISTVNIYFTDGIHKPQWGTICAKSSLPNTAKVICRQLGRSDGHKSLGTPPSSTRILDETVSVSSPSASRIWLTNVSCSSGDNSVYTHILQCSYSVIVADNTDNMCQNDDILRINCDRMEISPYSGQVRLCSPDGFDDGNQSVSIGLVQIYLYGGWGGINQYNPSHPLASHSADSICRQLGYTNAVAGSVMTQTSASSWLSNSTNNVSFSGCYNRIDTNKQAWFKTEQVECDQSQDCFGCCFSYPSRSIMCSDCKIVSDIVIRCTFDHTVSQETKQRNCSFVSQSDFKSLKHSACAQQVISLRLFEIIIGTVGSVALILFLTLSTVGVGYCSYRLYRRARQQPQGRGQHQLLHQHDDAGN